MDADYLETGNIHGILETGDHAMSSGKVTEVQCFHLHGQDVYSS
jgi:hypothetical protein